MTDASVSWSFLVGTVLRRKRSRLWGRVLFLGGTEIGCTAGPMATWMSKREGYHPGTRRIGGEEHKGHDGEELLHSSSCVNMRDRHTTQMGKVSYHKWSRGSAKVDRDWVRWHDARHVWAKSDTLTTAQHTLQRHCSHCFHYPISCQWAQRMLTRRLDTRVRCHRTGGGNKKKEDKVF